MKQDARKLTLSKETIRRLAEEDLAKVQGGGYGYTAGCQPCTSGNDRCTCPSFII